MMNAKQQCGSGCGKRILGGSQLFPCKGLLAGNSDLRLAELRVPLGQNTSVVYCYVVKTVDASDERFAQTGCAPNWQGDLITLCTCKHAMRASRVLKETKDLWIAGFASHDAAEDRNALVYMMKVDQMFESHNDVWWSLEEDTRRAKDTSRSRNYFGDIFRPISKLAGDERFDPNNYYAPCRDHEHSAADEWHRDVDGLIRGQRPALLVGDREQSYLWSKPLLFLPGTIHRGCFKCSPDNRTKHGISGLGDLVLNYLQDT